MYTYPYKSNAGLLPRGCCGVEIGRKARGRRKAKNRGEKEGVIEKKKERRKILMKRNRNYAFILRCKLFLLLTILFFS